MESGTRKIRDIIEDPELIWKDHFELASGKHSNIYWGKFRVLEDPTKLSAVCEPIAERFRDELIDFVVGPTLGGVLVAYEVARQLGTTALFLERGMEGIRKFRQPVILNNKQRVVIVDDVLMTGFTLQKIYDAIHLIGAEIVGAAVIMDRSNQLPGFDHTIFAVHKMTIPDFEPSECPLCRKNIPLVAAAGRT